MTTLMGAIFGADSRRNQIRPARPWRRPVWPLVLAAVLAHRAVAPAVESVPQATTPPRLSLVDGDVSFWRPGSEAWAPARMNIALAVGDALYAGQGANIELQVGGMAFVRAADGAVLTLVDQDPRYLQLKATSGHVAIDVRELSAGETFELDTPHAAITFDRIGYYRADIGQDETLVIVRRNGAATVVPVGGQASIVMSDEEVVVRDGDPGTVTMYAAPDVDAWDDWNYRRTDRIIGADRSYYLPSDVYGREDLNQYGQWRLESTYGRVWVPAGVGPEWAPYSNGRWMWDPYYHWTWVDNAPWGWAPYHYGRWVRVNGLWAWAPGPVVATPVYSPALVAFFDVGSNVHVGFNTPGFAWVALGWGEPLIPWWGPPGYVGVPCWHGWHGPRFVNHRHVHEHTVIRANRVTSFENTRVHNAVVAAPRERFHGQMGDSRRIRPEDARHLRPVHGVLPVNPTSASLAPAAGRGRRPPEEVQHRQVVATRPGRDPVAPLRGVGLSAPQAVQGPPPRLVTRPAFGPGAGGRPPSGPGADRSGRQRPSVEVEQTAPPAARPDGPGAPPSTEHRPASVRPYAPERRGAPAQPASQPPFQSPPAAAPPPAPQPEVERETAPHRRQRPAERVQPSESVPQAPRSDGGRRFAPPPVAPRSNVMEPAPVPPSVHMPQRGSAPAPARMPEPPAMPPAHMPERAPAPAPARMPELPAMPPAHMPQSAPVPPPHQAEQGRSRRQAAPPPAGQDMQMPSRR